MGCKLVELIDMMLLKWCMDDLMECVLVVWMDRMLVKFLLDNLGMYLVYNFVDKTGTLHLKMVHMTNHCKKL